MKYSRLVYLFIFFTLPLNAQVDSIELPDGDETIQVRKLMQFSSIYVDSKNQVYLEKELISIKNIGIELYANISKLPEELQMSVFVYLFVDKSAKYNIVDEIKTQIASAGLVNIFYKTKSLDDKDLLNGIFSKNHGSLQKITNFEEEKPIADWEPGNENEGSSMDSPMAGLNIPPPPPPPPMYWDSELQEQMYKMNKKEVSITLESKSYVCVRLTNKGIEVNSRIIEFDNVLNMEKVFQENELILVQFDDNLDYENYFRALGILKSIKEKLGNKTSVLELSSELMNSYEKNDIKICD